MDEKSKQLNILLEQLDKLPPQLKDAIFSDVNADKMFDIGKRYGLLIDKVGEMTNETGLLMLGVTHPNEFVGNLAERLQVDRATASKIADDINREIFAPVRDHLRGMFGNQSQKEISEERPPETGGLTSEISKSSSSETGLDSRLRGNDKVTTDATLEDLEAELKKALAESSFAETTEDKGIGAGSVIEKSAPSSQSPAKPAYSDVDPYREQIEEDMPNVRGTPYKPTTAQKEISEERPPETGGLTSKISQNSGFRSPASRVQPTPTPPPIEEPSLFSPLKKPILPQSNQQEISEERLPENGRLTSKISQQAPTPSQNNTSSPYTTPLRDKYREPLSKEDAKGPLTQNGALPIFRGFNMNNAPKIMQEPSKTPEPPLRATAGFGKPPELAKTSPTPVQPRANQKEISEERLPETGRLTSKISQPIPPASTSTHMEPKQQEKRDPYRESLH